MKSTLGVLTAAALILIPLAACAQTGQKDEGPAPAFSVTDLQGRTVTLADFKGKVLVLNFWATWCPPCRAEIPAFVEAYEELEGEGLAILGLSTDRMSNEQLSEWLASFKVNYPVAFATPEIVRDYRPGDFIPATLIVDPQGRIRYRHVGVMDKDTLVELFRKFK